MQKPQADHRYSSELGAGLRLLRNPRAICEIPVIAGSETSLPRLLRRGNEVANEIFSVHERIAHFLRLRHANPVPSFSIGFVANALDQQLDWPKRLRELRYPVIGLEIEVSKKKDKKGTQSFYALKNWRELPKDHVRLIKEYENQKKKP